MDHTVGLVNTGVANPAVEGSAAAVPTATTAFHLDPAFNCRMYEERYPDIDTLVMVNVRQIAEMGAYVTLLEYGGIEGMILFTELSRRRIRSIQKLVRVGRNEVVVVVRVDREKGYIDLSKRRVSPEDVEKCEVRFAASRLVHGVMRVVAERVGTPLERLYERVGWPFYRIYGHAIEALRNLASGDPAVVEDVWKRLETHTREHGVTVNGGKRES